MARRNASSKSKKGRPAVGPLPVEALRWRCDPQGFEFETTEEVEPVAGVVGQASAVEALRFGLETEAPGQNVFVRGLIGTGRMSMVRRLLSEMRPSCADKQDRCYVHNFGQPDRPRLISLPQGRARAFRRQVADLREFVRAGLREALQAEALRARRKALEEGLEAEVSQLTQPFDEALDEANLSFVTLQIGPVVRPAIFPRHGGKPVPPDEFERLHTAGEVSDQELEAFRSNLEVFHKRMQEVAPRVSDLRQRAAQELREFDAQSARELLEGVAGPLLKDFPTAPVRAFLRELIEDVIENRLGDESDEERGEDGLRLYGVNVLVGQEPGAESPVVIENTPTMANLLGTVEREWGAQGPRPSDYDAIRPGSLLRADGGFLILDVRDVHLEPGAWKVLVRTLRSSRLEIVPPEQIWPMLPPSIKPEPIPVRVRVILVGDGTTYALLDRYDPDFPHLFKVLADFDNVIDREPDGVRQYAGVLARIAQEESLPPFQRTAVAALCEYGARVAAHHGKLTARFGRIADIAREAAHLARSRRSRRVSSKHVVEAISRTKRRADLPSRRFQELVADGIIHVQVDGLVVGQINGLAVIGAGPVVYGFPARITATIGAGSAGIIDIEGQSALSGAIHTKGFHILGGLLRHLLQTDHPLAFSASLAFEQSYGGIDGDSASGAEICCLLSALTGIPIRQGLAFTGAIDQFGRIQAIGGVNEKIEGFFDACHHVGLSGEQGVIIPRANAGDLMLRPDVVSACRRKRFRIFAVDTVRQALELLTGVPAGERDAEGEYPEGSLLAAAVERAGEYWFLSLQNPVMLQQAQVDGEVEEGEPGAPVPPGQRQRRRARRRSSRER